MLASKYKICLLKMTAVSLLDKLEKPKPDYFSWCDRV